MNVLVCVKRVPDVGAKFSLTDDGRAVQTRNLGFSISPHEECAVEEAVRLVEAHGGRVTVLTLGPPEADEQLRDAIARGAERGVLLQTDGDEWAPEQTAGAIAAAVRAQGEPFDLLLFGNESADSADFQVGVRVAHALDLPCVSGIKHLELRDGTAVAGREIPTGWEVYEVPLPAVVAVKEGLNLPRHPSLRGRMAAKKAAVETLTPERGAAGLAMERMTHPAEQDKQVQVLGEGPEAAPRVVDLLKELEVLS